jgi:phosphoribosyl isomerase A
VLLVIVTLLPAVDVADGRAVRLVQGNTGTGTAAYGDLGDAALAWQADGVEWIHLVDLDAAFGRGSNATLLAAVIGELDVKVALSGGIRGDGSLERALSTGCEAGQPRHGGASGPGMVRTGDRRARRARRGQR